MHVNDRAVRHMLAHIIPQLHTPDLPTYFTAAAIFCAAVHTIHSRTLFTTALHTLHTRYSHTQFAQLLTNLMQLHTNLTQLYKLSAAIHALRSYTQTLHSHTR
jgi:hypothetical protein